MDRKNELMSKDGLVFSDKEERIIFNYYSFREILKGCIVHYCDISANKASDLVENAKLFESPLANVNDVYFFSHEHPFHWAMICCLGNSYWEKNPSLAVIPETYDDWERDFIKENGLMEEVFVFS